MPRARVFVLREKQNEVLMKVSELYGSYMNDGNEDYGPEVEELRQKLVDMFEVNLSNEEIMEHVGSDLTVASLIARKLLDKNPPDTKPSWFAPWND